MSYCMPSIYIECGLVLSILNEKSSGKFQDKGGGGKASLVLHERPSGSIKERSARPHLRHYIEGYGFYQIPPVTPFFSNLMFVNVQQLVMLQDNGYRFYFMIPLAFLNFYWINQHPLSNSKPSNSQLSFFFLFNQTFFMLKQVCASFSS